MRNLENLHLERFAERQEGQRPAGRVLEIAESSLDDLDEPGRRRQRAAQPPDTPLAVKHAGPTTAAGALPHDKRVTFPSLLPHPHPAPVPPPPPTLPAR